LKELLKYLSDYKKETVLAPLFKMLEAGFELFVPLVMANIIDVGVANRDSRHVLLMGLVLILLGVVGLVSSITAQYFAAKAATGFGTGLRKDLFIHINSMTYGEIDHVGTPTLLTRLTSDVNQVQNGVNMVLRLFLRSPFIVFGAMIMAFTVDVKAALIFVVVIPVLSVIVFGIMLITMPYYGKTQKQLDRVLMGVRESLAGVRVIRAFNRQEDENQKFTQCAEELKNTQSFVGRISALLNPVTYIVINCGIIAVLWVGGKRVNTGALTQGQVVALVNYMSQILVELIKLANLIILLTKSMACGKRIADVFAVKPSMEEGNGNFSGGRKAPKVIMEHVSFRYGNGGDLALSDISFRVNRGDTVGVIGGTGSGKTTLVNLIARFYDATEGGVLIDGMDVKRYSFKRLRDMVGVVPQKAVLFAGTIRENMRWGKPDATDEEIKAAMEIAQAKEILTQKEEGLDTMLLQGGKNLSGGQRQRLTIARALVKKPDILILDDSASALDFATDARLRNALLKMEGDTTVFLVSQRISTVRNADHILVLDDGKLVGQGTHSQLYEQCQVYREICQSQMTGEEAER
jgi:ABC-type multidrug transport system fused ATPase/permease subunit